MPSCYYGAAKNDRVHWAENIARFQVQLGKGNKSRDVVYDTILGKASLTHRNRCYLVFPERS